VLAYLVQDGVAVCVRPCDDVVQYLGSEEEVVLQGIRRLRRVGIIWEGTRVERAIK
jgi:hypothetical protein